MQFDSRVEIVLGVRPASTSGALTEVSVRWPTDEEWNVRARSRKIIIRRLGRGVTENVPAKPSEADVKLYQAIAQNGAPAMTPGEAAKLLGDISVADVNDVQIEGNEAVVDMTVMTGQVTHRLRVPLTDEVIAFRASAFRVLNLPFDQQELRLTPDAGARLYDLCGGSSQDYASPIPNVHKDAVVKAVIEVIDRAVGPRQDDANF